MPWITDKLCFKCTLRDRLFKLVSIRPNKDRLKQYYNRFRNNLKLKIKQAKERFSFL